jgi:hypothetical protein
MLPPILFSRNLLPAISLTGKGGAISTLAKNTVASASTDFLSLSPIQQISIALHDKSR